MLARFARSAKYSLVRNADGFRPPSALRDSSHRVHHALNDRRLTNGADGEGRGKAVVEGALHLRKLVENPHGAGADLCGPAAEAPAQFTHLTCGCKRSSILHRLDGRLAPLAAFDRILVRRSLCSLVRLSLRSLARLGLRSLAQQCLDVAGMIFAH